MKHIIAHPDLALCALLILAALTGRVFALMGF